MTLREYTPRGRYTVRRKPWYHLARTYLILLGLLAFLLTALARFSPEFAEHFFALGLYKYLSQGLSVVTGVVPIAVGELLLYAGIILLFVLLIRFILKIVNSSYRMRTFGRGMSLLLAGLCVVYFVFTLTGGLNYYRYNFTYYSGLEVQESSVQELYALCGELAENAVAARAKLSESPAATGTTLAEFGELSSRAQLAYGKLSEQYEVLGGYYGKPKPVISSRLMSHARIEGIFNPFTMEANVNRHMPLLSIPAAACHELSHLRGFMREDEANFISYLACTGSGDALFEYSGYLLAFSYAGGRLAAADYALYEQVWNTLSPQVVDDLRADNAYWKQFESVVATVSNAVNNTYLQANNQTDGVQSYGRMVDLLLADFRVRHAS